MRNPALLLLLSAALAGPLAAQPAAPRLHPDVPAAFDVAGLHLVLNAEAQRLVQQRADGLCRHQPSFQARVDLADAAFPIIDRVLQAEGVPLDFRYLALQESALQGDARSVHEAVGYWQLKQETATELGLAVNEAVDERQHLAASTRAAARYLARSNVALRNWLNALLSYNTGLTGVRPYTLPTDADATQVAITEATSPYVLMFLAQKLAFEPACGQNPKPVLRLREFPAQPGQTLEAQALALHVEPAALAAHNHWLRAPAVPADRPYTLIVPVGDLTQAAGIVANQRLQSSRELLALPAVAANAAEVRLNDLRALIALPGETTADLARRANQRLGEFLHHNELTAFDAAVPGRPYYLESKRDAAAVEYHVLQPGETVFDVAQKYGLRKRAILAKNRLARVEELRPGRVLWLQHVRPREVAVEYRTLPEGVALERPTGAAGNAAARPNPAAEAAAARRDAALEAANARPAKARSPDERDGWGETLSSATAAAAVVAAPKPAPVAAPPARLPPPAPAPAPAPLADEPRPRAPAPTSASAVAPPVAPPVVAVAPRSAAGPAPAPALALPARPVAATPDVMPAAGTHRVEPKETLYAISRRYGLTAAALMALNKLTPPANLVVGQVLVVKGEAAGAGAAAPAADLRPVAAPRPAATTNPALYAPKAPVPPSGAPAAAATQHTVASGETLYSIARRYGVTVADLLAWNTKANGSVKLGEVLVVKGK